MRYNTVVFDLDGTLLDTLEDLKNATNYALESNGYPARTLDEVRRFVGNGVRRLMERALPEGMEGQAFEEVFDAFKKYYAVHCEDTTCIYDGVLQLLEKLKEAGCQMAIVSNKLDSAVKELNGAYFHGLISSAIGENEQAGIRKKPAPDMVQAALRELGSKPEKTVYVGDSDVDVMTAANAGLDCISVTWGFRSVDFLKAHGAKVLADNPEEVYRLIVGE